MISNLKRHIKTLSAQPRFLGSEGLKIAQNYIKGSFKKYGIECREETFYYPDCDPIYFGFIAVVFINLLLIQLFFYELLYIKLILFMLILATEGLVTTFAIPLYDYLQIFGKKYKAK